MIVGASWIFSSSSNDVEFENLRIPISFYLWDKNFIQNVKNVKNYYVKNTAEPVDDKIHITLLILTWGLRVHFAKMY